ncbi:MAG: thioredoxin family protein [Planctomycetes bacterium]|nr:thioredoxin family protein [Planctomycetota bacterium]
MKIEILGPGCRDSDNLCRSAHWAVRKMGIEAEIVRVENAREIIRRGVLMTPALAIDERVVSVGRVLQPADIQAILESSTLV